MEECKVTKLKTKYGYTDLDLENNCFHDGTIIKIRDNNNESNRLLIYKYCTVCDAKELMNKDPSETYNILRDWIKEECEKLNGYMEKSGMSQLLFALEKLEELNSD